MVTVLTSSSVDLEFEPRSCQTKEYIIGMCCFFPKHTSLRRKSISWLARNQDNVSEWIDMSTRGRLCSELPLCKYNSAYWSIKKRLSFSSHRM
jgi:hypothetical protein